jgi:hypothetical protein
MYVVITGTSGHFLADVSAVDKSLGVKLPVTQITAGVCYERHQTGRSGWSTYSDEAIFSPIYFFLGLLITTVSGRTMAVGSTQPLTEMSTTNISWEVKATGA